MTKLTQRQESKLAQISRRMHADATAAQQLAGQDNTEALVRFANAHAYASALRDFYAGSGYETLAKYYGQRAGEYATGRANAARALRENANA